LRSEDGCIVRRCLNGEKVAFGLLVDKYRESVYALAYSKVRNFHDAQDIAQEVFIIAYKKLHTLRHWERFAFWLNSITVNVCRAWARGQARRSDSGFMEDQDPRVLVNQSLESYHEELPYKELHEALNSLPEIHSQVLILHHLAGMTIGDMAAFLAISRRTIARRLGEAREKLKKEMLDTARTTLEQHGLPAGFTLNILEWVKGIRIRPVPWKSFVPWGVSLSTSLIFAFLAFSSSRSFQYQSTSAAVIMSSGMRRGRMGTSQLYTSKAFDVFLIPEGQGNGIGNIPEMTTPEISESSASFTVESSTEIKTVKWVRDIENPIAISGKEGEWDQEVNSPVVVFDGSEYKMWYGGCNGITARIGLATSSDGISWAKYDGNPVLKEDGSGWDSLYVTKPAVLLVNGEYKMWYAGYIHPEHYRIGYATSKDGIEWVRHPDNPVLDIGEKGAWDSIDVRTHEVIFDGAEYKMWYTGQCPARMSRIGYATSKDGVVWTKHSGNPVLDLGEPGTWDSQGVRAPCVIFDGHKYEMWYNGTDRNYRIGYATSIDGITWTKHPDNPVFDLGAKGTWDDDEVAMPFVLKSQGEYRMWYSGFDGRVSRIGYATGIVRPESKSGKAEKSIKEIGRLRQNIKKK